MSTTVRIEDRLFETLESLGDVERAVQTALRRYTVEQIVDKISGLQAEDRRWQEKCGCDYETFVEKMASDKAFHQNVEQRLNPMWEEDLIHWEFCHEGVRDWRSHLEALRR
jgi:hypothetical protein